MFVYFNMFLYSKSNPNFVSHVCILFLFLLNKQGYDFMNSNLKLNIEFVRRLFMILVEIIAIVIPEIVKNFKSIIFDRRFWFTCIVPKLYFGSIFMDKVVIQYKEC